MSFLNQEAIKLYQISELNRLVKRCLQYEFGQVYVVGEISNLTVARSGHAYFSLKDADAQVTCALFSRQACPFELEDGQMVKAQATVGLYEARGQYQLIVQKIEPYGQGQLRKAYEALKKELHSAGLFDTKHKNKCPDIPSTIGIITSPQAAALADVEKVLLERFPYAHRILYPAQVQGSGAAETINKALRNAIDDNRADVLLLVRGGGSLEDLWEFNDKQLAYSIAACPIPLITGVGHETDTTIVDFVADHAAPTPSAAAIYATPHQNDLAKQLKHQQQLIQKGLRQSWQEGHWHLDQLKRRYLSPQRHIQRQHDLIQQWQQRIWQYSRYKVMHRESQLSLLTQLLQRTQPHKRHEQQQDALNTLKKHLIQTTSEKLGHLNHTHQQLSQQLQLLNPLHVLARGYAVITDEGGRLINGTEHAILNKTVHIQWGQQRATALITHVEQDTCS